MEKIPDWFEEAAVLKAAGNSARQVADELCKRGYVVTHDTVWQWVWPSGAKKRAARQDPEFKRQRREYTKQWRRTRYDQN